MILIHWCQPFRARLCSGRQIKQTQLHCKYIYIYFVIVFYWELFNKIKVWDTRHVEWYAFNVDDDIEVFQKWLTICCGKNGVPLKMYRQCARQMYSGACRQILSNREFSTNSKQLKFLRMLSTSSGRYSRWGANWDMTPCHTDYLNEQMINK